MAVEDPPGVLDGDSTPSEVQRHMLQGLLGAPIGAFAGGVGATSGGGHGVAGTTDLAVSQSVSPGMSVDVAKGIAFITGTVSAVQGPYSFYNNAPVTLTIAAAHATLARRDLIVAQIQDATYSGAVRSARLLVVTGTPSGSPADPSLSLTPNALVLARVTVPGGASSIVNANVTDLRTFAYALGASEAPQPWNVTQVFQGAPRACTTSYGWYQRSNGVWRAQLNLTGFAAGSAGSPIFVTTPVILPNLNAVTGTFVYNDAGTTIYVGGVTPNSTADFLLVVNNNAGNFGQLPSVALAPSDLLILQLQGRY